MNTLKILSETKRGVFENLHPSDPLYVVVESYDAAAEFMEDDVPSSQEILSAMYDVVDVMIASLGTDDDIKVLKLHEIETILKQNGFDFISHMNIRENPSQSYLGGGGIGI